jgi:prepilin-type N-terminal cleavage/methylation domain-containing protein/prepilin-type processing-associated H-X9-DG protein
MRIDSFRPRQRTQRAFTLIELLVVIAIIAILAAILFPVFARARENARKASCQSNLKQVASAALMYAQDYDETLPPSAIYELPYPTGLNWWPDLLHPYTKNWQVAICPSQGTGENAWYPATPHGQATTINYFPPDWIAGLKMAQIGDTAGTILYLDGWGEFWSASHTDLNLGDAQWLYDTYLAPMGWTGSAPGSGIPSLVAKVHMDGCNIAFADGHVKWMRTTTRGMWTPTEND